ncbi:MAG TPA: transcription termination factor Rho [Anaerolineae bacterium]|nr:transcription termination factor Rho [Anaerolineae bacterium]
MAKTSNKPSTTEESSVVVPRSSSKKGIFRGIKGGAGLLIDPNQPEDEVWVPAKLVNKYRLVEGATVAGSVRTGKPRPQLVDVESVCGLAPEMFPKRTTFKQLIAVDPNERFPLAASGESAMRIVELVAPIGKGTRGLIVSPPKAGKTMLLEQLAQAIRAGDPETRIIVLLIDERPEEVTFFQRAVDAEVFASSSDQRLREHVALAELMLAHIRTELECGRDVVVLLDSLTRMARTFNLKGSGRGGGRSLSGGLEAGALEIPRRFFGLARNIEDGGSVTILATALVDTGSRLDQVVFEEFKGTGNSEIVLDRSLAEARLFPAINVTASGTRKAHLLYSAEEYQRLARLQRALAERPPKDALTSLLQLLEKYPTNEALLEAISV